MEEVGKEPSIEDRFKQLSDDYKTLSDNYVNAMQELTEWHQGKRNIKSVVLPKEPNIIQYNLILKWLKEKRASLINAEVPPKPLKEPKL